MRFLDRFLTGLTGLVFVGQSVSFYLVNGVILDRFDRFDRFFSHTHMKSNKSQRHTEFAFKPVKPVKPVKNGGAR